MGLAGPRKRTKIGHDPNNTAWTRDTTTFGHKILTSQGWAPGSLLGASDAAHASLHTAANASHIRVAIKDDTLGLGAKNGTRQAEGAVRVQDALQGLFERLNGKSEDVVAQGQRAREDVRRGRYVEKRFGQMTFVSGGVLVGDDIRKLAEDEAERVRKREKKERKRRREEKRRAKEAGEDSDSSAARPEKSKKRKKRKKGKKLEDTSN
ncbi:MAG: telomerase inhibitor [Thelocarpon impressellum]|nr:MAG: telomerase inhibitor [Thelocarpon impressellum]